MVSVISISNVKWKEESFFGTLSLWTHLHSNETISDVMLEFYYIFTIWQAC